MEAETEDRWRGLIQDRVELSSSSSGTMMTVATTAGCTMGGALTGLMAGEPALGTVLGAAFGLGMSVMMRASR